MSSDTITIDFTQIHIRKTQPDEVGLVADLCVDGSTDHAVWGMIDLHTQHPDAEHFIFQGSATLMLNGDTYLICHGDNVIGDFFLSTPGAPTVASTWDILRVGWSIPFRFGWEFTKKLVDLFDSVGKQLDPVVERFQPAVTFERFVIRSEWRGRGIGRYVLDAFVLKDRKRVILSTQKKAKRWILRTCRVSCG